MTSLASETSAEPKPRAEPPAATDGPLYGSQRPRLLTLPGVALSSAGQEAVDLAERAGLKLDSWQRFVLDKGMSERADGNWAAPEVCVNVPRQNGKGAVIEARVLWGLFIGGEKQILLSAHEFKTTHNTMKRIERLIEGCPDLLKRVKQFHKTVGREGIELHDGRELKYIARSRGSGRGFTADCVIFDECMILGDDAMSALAPTADAVDNSQLWYLGSAGIGHLSQQMARLRKRCLTSLESGVPDPVLAYMEWSINQHRAECMPGCTEHDDIDSVQSLLRANPGVGYRLQVEKSMQRRLTMGDHLYARERLGVGEYPSDEADTWQVIGEDAWRSLAAAESAPEGEVVFAIDATPEQDHAAIAVAGRWRGGTHIEIAHHQPGMSWVVAKAKRMQEEHKPRCWVVDAGGPAGALIKELEDELGITVVSPKMREIAQAAGQFFNAVADQSISHIDQPLMATALAGAQKRPLGEAWAWARRGVGVDISPLVAATNAKWGLGVEVEDDVDPLDNIF